MLGQIIIALLIGYLFGSIQPAYFLSKLVAKTDIREHGSGNAGASNITAIMGWKYGFIVAFVDVLKAMLAVLLVKWIYPQNPDLAYLAGIMAILGHLFPFYMNFRGGKGVAALAGMMLGINWKLGILFMLLVALPALIADYIVVGSLTAFIALPITTYILEYPTALIIIGALMTLLAFYLHRGNIKRIINKEELKISTVLKRKKS
ncbi:MAG: glycerol-3-phosphate 1-O-acyltransferase PlsY [Anaerolineae bacterium]|jgi:glycerol-3-phosphate acyltransferase PlsY|nr:glycerol-3-phosphate 1-O-acyltransferase PlsY [Anaerolineae bacterium]MBT7190023.1 glycerol-3-phosphate 1-O-acyltransferase PlsY [Anaerolineae bacterium]MBT7989679.1 glycerol-3-phosphate 1-O-acyltransferase PlsY [Anaerolineae bacterium]